ncbi:uncharacterized protein CMU_039650 [Cryptosporidium muris RN66]|uniref:EF-hand domain-containing protein n=1 Tax=Cryptosporidium muris (strain RN66) TaxID=441375 RepID=B6A9K5_CRYMR|nr:uncharacterized protein CMU_039650 [Cryptosporidium muris RN66]EEA04896.1 hypothetical protein, conserved [Cryptosporidium muris RN66]|eukprot:XP_002139245.1 hypothetical protein [Cryptosporidium muris RN66]
MDREKTGRINDTKLIHMLKSIGVKLSRRDLLAISAEVRERGEYTVDDILKIGEVVYNDEVIAKDLVDALLFISGGRDIISASELRRYLLLTGSIVKLTEEEVDCILSDIGESVINIYDFVAYCITE